MISLDQAETIAAAIELPDWVMAKSASLMYSLFGPAFDAFESTVKFYFPAPHAFMEKWSQTHAHPFAERLPFLNPWHGLASLLAYLCLVVVLRVFSGLVGKFSCRGLGVVHNLGLHLLSLYMSIGLMVSARAAGYSLWNNGCGTSPAEWRIAKLIWLFYVSKVIEWLDTVIMLLKQNYHQVSFLHVYHHGTIFLLWWLASLVAPGGESYYSAMVNSGVHVFMYGYYLLTLLFPSGSVRNVLNRFKFVITKGQMLQFSLNCLQSVYDLVWIPRAELNYNADLMHVLFWYMISLLLLFGNFLTKNRETTGLRHGRDVAAKQHPAAKASGSDSNEACSNAKRVPPQAAERRQNKGQSPDGQEKKKYIQLAQPMDIDPVFKNKGNTR